MKCICSCARMASQLAETHIAVHNSAVQTVSKSADCNTVASGQNELRSLPYVEKSHITVPAGDSINAVYHSRHACCPGWAVPP